MKTLVFIVFLAVSCVVAAQPHAVPVTPFLAGHAHNDYAQHRPPLTNALRYGMVSIEIDVYPRQGKLRVSHLPFGLASKPDFEEMYLDPMVKWLSHFPHFFKDSQQPLILMIDIKDQPAEAYTLIKELVNRYPQLFSKNKEGFVPAEILLSGKKPWEEVAADSARYARVDAGLEQIGDKKWTAQWAPRVSCRYPFRWRGKGEMPTQELAQLRQWIQQAHADNRQIRFWAMPQNEKVFNLFLKEGVDWLNIDNLSIVYSIELPK